MSELNKMRLEWIAEDPASQRTLEIAAKVADTPTTVLITGESGTGKDQLARWIHESGARRDAPFLKIDCASLPPELVESELFGHERGAFTGAEARKPGRMELAENGTIVLDEVAALPPPIQAKLLRILEERKFERLGGTETLEMDARLIALTNADLERDVRSGYFREDLYFRLNVLPIPIPPLRERHRDIRPLAEHFVKRLAPVHGHSDATIDSGAMQALEAYAWPGNVRELKNVIERALIFAQTHMLRRDDFPPALTAAAETLSQAKLRSLEEIEKEAVRITLDATHYKIARAAEILGISRKTLLEKRKKYGFI
jgi:two-component system response regulator AtoC